MIKNTKLKSIKTTLKSGAEKLTLNHLETEYTLMDFWKWSVSDILSNTARGRFAEFIVGTTLDIDLKEPREEWDAYDLTTKSGIKIEVKSASYIQSWEQSDYSKISFSIKKVRHWDVENARTRGKAKRHADVYVFCLLKHKEQETINPLKMEQWEFYVMPTFMLDNHMGNQNRISLNPLSKLAKPCSYKNLGHEINEVYKNQLENK